MSAKIYNAPAMMTALDKITARLAQASDREIAGGFNNDLKLAWITARVGEIASITNRAEGVLKVACCAFAWLESLAIGPTDIIARIADERLRQRELFAARKHHFRVDSPVVDWTRKLRVLVEEVGEVAQEIDNLEASNHSKKLIRQNLQAELVQVAAVAVAWLEAYET